MAGKATEDSEVYDGRPSDMTEEPKVRVPNGPLRSDLRGTPRVSTLPKVKPVRVDCWSYRDERGEVPPACLPKVDQTPEAASRREKREKLSLLSRSEEHSE